jgi:hypothetical protein
MADPDEPRTSRLQRKTGIALYFLAVLFLGLAGLVLSVPFRTMMSQQMWTIAVTWSLAAAWLAWIFAWVGHAIRHGRFRFTLKTFFVVTAILAVALAWTAVQLKWIRDRRAALESAGIERRDIYYANLYATIGRSPPRTPAPVSLMIFGEEGVQEIWVLGIANEANRARVAEIQAFFPEATVTRKEPGH